MSSRSTPPQCRASVHSAVTTPTLPCCQLGQAGTRLCCGGLQMWSSGHLQHCSAAYVRPHELSGGTQVEAFDSVVPLK